MHRTLASALCLLLVAAPMGAGCGGRSIRPEAPAAPRLTSERLGDVRSALTYEGDWMGGTPAEEGLAETLDLARRRGVETIVDLRREDSRDALSLEAPAGAAGMELVTVDRALPSAAIQEIPFEISNGAIDRIREILCEPGRSPVLLLDDDGVLSASVYAIHLTADLGVDVDEALRGARASGLTDQDVAFVRRQVTRIRG